MVGCNSHVLVGHLAPFHHLKAAGCGVQQPESSSWQLIPREPASRSLPVDFNVTHESVIARTLGSYYSTHSQHDSLMQLWYCTDSY